MYVSTHFRRLAQKSRSLLVLGALALHGAFATPVLAQTQVTNTANVTLPTGIVDSNTANNTSSVTVAVQALPRLTLVKQVVNDNGGTAVATAWTLTATGPATTISGATGTAAVTSAAVQAGSYALTESGGPAGYAASTWNCVKNGGAAVAANTISLVGGDVATCTITNNDQAATLTLVKTVINDNGGTATVSNFPLTATGPTTITGVSGTAAVTNATVNAGVYTLSEVTAAGYAAGTWSCTAGTLSGNQLTLANGQSASCSITNNDQAATLTLVKTVINDNGGTATVSNFPLTATGPTTITGVSGTAAVTNASVNAGVYTLSEVTAAGYAAGTWSCTAGTLSGNQLTLANGQSASCSITNNDQASTLTLVKTVINTGGGTATVSNFPLTATGPTTITGVSGTAAVTSASVNAGVYTLSEATVANYTAGSWSCTAGTLSGNQLTLVNGQSATCSITNTFQPAPALVLDKTASPTTVTAAGQVVTYSFLVNNTGNVAINALQINETAFSGTGAAPAITCPVSTLAAGANTTCTGTYAVTQQDIDAGSVTNTATASGTNPAGGTTTSPADSATVTSTATPNVSIVKTGPATVVASSSFQYTLTLTNNGSRSTGTNLIVQDQLPAGMQATAASGAACTNLSAPGALLTCTVPGPIVPGGTAVVTLTVTAPAASGLANTTRTFTNYAATNPTGTGNPGTPPGSGCVNSATTSCGSVNTVVLSPYLQLNKSASGATFTLGVPASYTLEVDNSGATATAVASTITDVMPAGLTIGSLPSGCTVSGQTVTCTIPAGLAAGAVASFVIPVTPTGAAVPQVINTATVSGGGDPGCPVQGRCSESVTTTVGFTSTLTLDKTASPTTMSAVGQVVTYSFLVSNTGNVEVTALQINETAFSGTGAAPAITCPVNTLAAGANTTCTGTYTVTQQDIDAGSLTNTATASGNSPTGSTTTSPPDSATVTSTAAPALTVAKTVTSTGPYALGSTISYSVVATNSGTVTLNNVVVSDPLLAAPNSTTCATLAPGASCTLTGSYAVQQTDVDAGQVVNTATADSNETDPETGTTTTPITQSSALTVAKTVTSTGPYALGSTISYSVVATNSGTVTLNNVVVSDPLLAAPNSTTCATLAPGASCTLTGSYAVQQTDVDAGQVVNTATADSNETDPETGTTTTPITQ
ncbi:DUF11 domain-containing protein, partial [Pseudoxanthomonas sp. PXM02]|uniref:DUF7507 domain-containing protein n=1 Tax=Pseudoxanthomonas sp. PXM02 TaxID=2769294 RepID=UPI00178113E8|nr:DUF11 domain-containing protein [Pseudoxanthomonas sp. PXM02]